MSVKDRCAHIIINRTLDDNKICLLAEKGRCLYANVSPSSLNPHIQCKTLYVWMICKLFKKYMPFSPFTSIKKKKKYYQSNRQSFEDLLFISLSFRFTLYLNQVYICCLGGKSQIFKQWFQQFNAHNLIITCFNFVLIWQKLTKHAEANLTRLAHSHPF